MKRKFTETIHTSPSEEADLLLGLSKASWASYYLGLVRTPAESVKVPLESSFATPVSAKPSHASATPDLISSSQESMIEVESPDVFGLRGGPILRNVKRTTREIKPAPSLLHLLERETSCLPDPNYMQMRQNGHFKSSRRLGKLSCLLIFEEIIQWMRETCKDYTFHPETLYIAVNFLDRYLSKVKVTMRKQFNLLALTCIYIAAKIYEEVKEPCLSDISDSSIDENSIKDIKRMERKIIQTLDFEFNVVTPHAIIQEVFSSLGTADIRDFEILSRDLSCDLGIPSPALRREVINKCQDYFDFLMNDYSCIHIQPSVLAYGVWRYLQKIGKLSMMLVTEKQLSLLLRYPNENHEETISHIFDLCSQFA